MQLQITNHIRHLPVQQRRLRVLPQPVHKSVVHAAEYCKLYRNTDLRQV